MTQININFNNYINLEDGTVFNIHNLSNSPNILYNSWHIYLAYNSDRNIHSVIFHNRELCEISMLTDSYDNVDLNIAINALFQGSLLDVAFETDKVIMIKKNSDYWKLGFISEDETNSIIKYSKLT